MGLGESDDVASIDDEGSGQREAPALFSRVVIVEARVVEGNVDEDGLEVATLFCGERLGEAELLGDFATCIAEQREGQAVLIEHKDVLTRSLRGDGDEESAAAA
ncbi:MAG TPA: hypothetical protein VK638_43980, partial [Edaphobacter sp.]|nr:hypothetical protein [Edaphobacter sp.]